MELTPLQTAPAVFLFGLVLFGLVLGSFVSALTWRLPRGENVAAGRSRCVHCGAALGVPDLFPLLSWLLSGGRCRHCGAGVSPRYPLIEVTTAILVTAAFLASEDLASGILLALFFTALFAMAVVDLEHGYLPDVLQVSAAALALVLVFAAAGAEGVGAALLSAVLAGGAAWLLRVTFFKITGRHGLGLGDVKFFAVAGLVLPLLAWPAFLLMSGVLGIAIGAAWKAWGRGPAFPFGPALVIALVLVLLFPHLYA